MHEVSPRWRYWVCLGIRDLLSNSICYRVTYAAEPDAIAAGWTTDVDLVGKRIDMCPQCSKQK